MKCTFGFIYIKLIRNLVKDIINKIKPTRSKKLLKNWRCNTTARATPSRDQCNLALTRTENIRVSSFRNTTPKLAALLNTCKSQMAQIYDGTGEHISEHLMIY